MPIEAPGPVWPVTKPTEIGAACGPKDRGSRDETGECRTAEEKFRREIICLLIVATSCWAAGQSSGGWDCCEVGDQGDG